VTTNMTQWKQAVLRIRDFPQPMVAEVDAGAARFLLAGRECRVADFRWDPPAVRTVYGAALNFRSALAALGDAVTRPPYQAPPRAPVLYIKPANTWSGWGAPIALADDVPDVQVGATLGVVMGKTACRVSAAEALGHVSGYVTVNDVTVPHQSYFRPAIYNKVRDGFCPMGPWVVAADAVADPDSLVIRAFVNGELRLEASTAEMVRPVATLIADISEFMTLSPGDVLLVGLPQGLPVARVGDRVAVEVEGVGRLENPVIAERALSTGGGA
jgi:5-oxopent-3-ene-1,2,5-tricarboxylate decarboxylase / 2-hydroxyhepta-2,4-diene-1,7-dioate isomerase